MRCGSLRPKELADHADRRFRDRRVLEQRALQIEQAEAMVTICAINGDW